MHTLLNLFSAIALLVWGTHIVRTGILRVYGSHLREMLGSSMRKRHLAFACGIGVTALVQSSNATALLTTSFVSAGLMGLAPALTILLGADVGTALMARVLTLDLASWLSPLLIFFGVILFLSRKQTRAGQLGRVAIGMGLILLALELIVSAATPITQAKGIQVLFSSLTGDLLLDALVGALFALVSYSSLAAVLLTATLAEAGLISLPVAIGLVVGANIGSGILALLSSSMQSPAGRRVALGSLLFKLLGLLLIMPVLEPLAQWMASLPLGPQDLVIAFHVIYNSVRCILMIPLVSWMSQLCLRLLPDKVEENDLAKPRHLDRSALDTPVLAMANASRETLRVADQVESLLLQLRETLQGQGNFTLKDIRDQDDHIDALYTAIKLYLTQVPRDDLSDLERRRWAEIVELNISLEQAGDLIEHMFGKLLERKTSQRRNFSDQGLAELIQLHDRLMANLQLALSLFLQSDRDSARQLLREKRRFQIQERRLTHAHLERLQSPAAQSLESSSLHLDLISDMKRLNSMFCSGAYIILDAEESQGSHGYVRPHEEPSEPH